MAQKTYAVNVQMGGNQTLGFRLENLAVAPGSPYGAGHAFYNTALGAPQFYDGALWRNPFARGDHTGTQLAATISNLTATVQAFSLSTFAAPTANLSFGGFKGVNQAAPTAAGDSATYDWTLSRPLNAFAVPTGPVAFNNQKLTGLGTATVAGDAADFSFVRGTRLDQFAAPTAPVGFGNQKITGVGTPTTTGDAATYEWVVGQIQTSAAGIASRPPVRAVATSNIATLSGTVTVDGVALVAGDRLLLPFQTTATQNGPYVIAAGAWTRGLDADQANELVAGATWLVTEGTVNAGTQWRQATSGAVTVGTTPISIVQFSVGASYTATNGVQLITGNFSVKLPAASGLVADATGLYLDTTVVGRKASGTIGDGTATSFVVTHNLGTQDILVAVRLLSSQSSVEVDWSATSNTTATIAFATPPAANAYRVTIMG